MAELSILIPARNEPYLQKTINDILEHSEVDTEIIVGIDGWSVELEKHERVFVHERKVPIGQRAMTNELAMSSLAPMS